MEMRFIVRNLYQSSILRFHFCAKSFSSDIKSAQVPLYKSFVKKSHFMLLVCEHGVMLPSP